MFSFSTLGQISVTAIVFYFFFLKALLMKALLIQILNHCNKRIGLCEGLQVDVMHGFSLPVVPGSPCSMWTFTLHVPEVHKQNETRPKWYRAVRICS